MYSNDYIFKLFEVIFCGYLFNLKDILIFF